MDDGQKIDATQALELIASRPCNSHAPGDPPHWCQRSYSDVAQWCPSCLANAALYGVKLPKLSPITSQEVTDEQYEEDLAEYVRESVARDEADGPTSPE